MKKSVSAADANRRFSELLRHVKQGKSVVVTSHGRPVARMVPVGGPDAVTARARDALMTRLRKAGVIDIGRWTRDELYED